MTHTEPTVSDWRTVLLAQGRTLRWLAIKTGKTPRTVYAYSQGKRTPPAEWLDAVARVLGEEVAA